MYVDEKPYKSVVILTELSGTISYKKEINMAGFSLSSGFVDSKKNTE